jgi:hypothetical protein
MLHLLNRMRTRSQLGDSPTRIPHNPEAAGSNPRPLSDFTEMQDRQRVASPEAFGCHALGGVAATRAESSAMTGAAM